MIRLTIIAVLLTAAASEILPQGAVPTVYRVPSEYAYFTAPEKPMPVYPSDAFINKIGGDVVLLVKYSTEGFVETVEPITGNSALATAATDAVKNWKFLPIKEKSAKAEGITYVGFHYVPSDDTVFSSFPFGNWDPVPASPALADTPPKPSRVRISS